MKNPIFWQKNSNIWILAHKFQYLKNSIFWQEITNIWKIRYFGAKIQIFENFAILTEKINHSKTSWFLARKFKYLKIRYFDGKKFKNLLILARKFKYDIFLWFSIILQIQSGIRNTKSSIFLTDLNVPLFLALMIEKSIAGKWISWTIAKILHFVNLGSVLLLPVYVINVKYEHIGPGIFFFFFFFLWCISYLFCSIFF